MLANRIVGHTRKWETLPPGPGNNGIFRNRETDRKRSYDSAGVLHAMEPDKQLLDLNQLALPLSLNV